MEHVGRGCGAAVRPGPSQPILRLPRTGLMPAIYPPQARPAGAQVLLESERAERAGDLLDSRRLDGWGISLLPTTQYPVPSTLLATRYSLHILHLATSLRNAHYSLITNFLPTGDALADGAAGPTYYLHLTKYELPSY